MYITDILGLIDSHHPFTWQSCFYVIETALENKSWKKEKLIFFTRGFLLIRLKFNGLSQIWLVFSNLTSLRFSWANAVTCNRQLPTKLDLFIFFSLIFPCWHIAWHNLLKTILNVCHWSPLVPPRWLSGERVGLMTWWLWVRSPVEATFLSGVFSPLTSAEACEKSSRWLWKEK